MSLTACHRFILLLRLIEKTTQQHLDRIFAQQKANHSAYDMVQTLLYILRKPAKNPDSASTTSVPTDMSDKRGPPGGLNIIT
jgi:hypothetical protein